MKTFLSAKREATFGMGCFWEPSESMLKKKGVVATSAGYCGASPTAKTPPDYGSVCYGREWVEAVRVVYDDAQISYNELLECFFELHKSNPNSRQYDSIVFADSDQMNDAESWLTSGKEARYKRKADNYPISLVKVEPISPFYKAEDYHQRYWQKWRVRFATIALLLTGGSGFYDSFFPAQFLENAISIRGLCNALVSAGCVGVLLERLIARNVMELKPGDLILSLEQNVK